MVVARYWEEGVMGDYFNDHRVSVLQVLEVDGGDGEQ